MSLVSRATASTVAGRVRWTLHSVAEEGRSKRALTLHLWGRAIPVMPLELLLHLHEPLLAQLGGTHACLAHDAIHEGQLMCRDRGDVKAARGGRSLRSRVQG